MKATRVVNLFIQLDALHRRIDFQRLTAHALLIGISIAWAWSGAIDGSFWSRFGIVLVLGIVVRLLLSRMGASRLSALLTISVLLTLGVNFSSSEVALAAVYVLVLLLAQEYFVRRTKFISLISTVAVGLIAAGAGPSGRKLLLLYAAVMVVRLLWHAVIERMSKRAFVLFAIKAIGAAVIAPTICVATEKLWPYSFGLPDGLPPAHVPVWLQVIIVLLAVRGLWATLLLKTDRSPQHRLLRLFYIFFGAGVFAVVVFVQHYGAHIFLPNALGALDSIGLASFGVTSIVYVLHALGLLVTAGIDRTLYKDTAIARWLRGLIDTGSTMQQMGGDK